MNRGRLPASSVSVEEIRDLTPDDLLCLRAPRSASAVDRLRDPHHALARLIALGIRPKEAAERTGFSISRVYVLHKDPAFQDLVATYRKDVDLQFRDAQTEYFDDVTSVNRKALRHIAEHFDKADAEGELIPLARALSVFTDTSDRVGISKKSTNVNVNVDFAAKLEAARARSDSARVINATQSPTLAPASQTPPKLVRRV